MSDPRFYLVQGIDIHGLEREGAQVVQQEVNRPDKIGGNPAIVAVRIEQQQGGYLARRK